jgi:hypothetical protein
MPPPIPALADALSPEDEGVCEGDCEGTEDDD